MLHPGTFDYLKPTDDQLRTMEMARKSTRTYADALEALLPDGPDKTYVLRKVREIGMWANVAITRHYDGSPRSDVAMPTLAQHAELLKGTRYDPALVDKPKNLMSPLLPDRIEDVKPDDPLPDNLGKF